MAIEVAVQRPEIGDVVDIERTETSVRGASKGTHCSLAWSAGSPVAQAEAKGRRR
jgi:hypothetical protein